MTKFGMIQLGNLMEKLEGVTNASSRLVTRHKNDIVIIQPHNNIFSYFLLKQLIEISQKTKTNIWIHTENNVSVAIFENGDKK